MLAMTTSSFYICMDQYLEHSFLQYEMHSISLATVGGQLLVLVKVRASSYLDLLVRLVRETLLSLADLLT